MFWIVVYIYYAALIFLNCFLTWDILVGIPRDRLFVCIIGKSTQSLAIWIHVGHPFWSHFTGRIPVSFFSCVWTVLGSSAVSFLPWRMAGNVPADILPLVSLVCQDWWQAHLDPRHMFSHQLGWSHPQAKNDFEWYHRVKYSCSCLFLYTYMYNVYVYMYINTHTHICLVSYPCGDSQQA